MVRSVVHDSNWKREWEEEEFDGLKEQAKIDRKMLEELKEQEKVEREYKESWRRQMRENLMDLILDDEWLLDEPDWESFDLL